MQKRTLDSREVLSWHSWIATEGFHVWALPEVTRMLCLIEVIQEQGATFTEEVCNSRGTSTLSQNSGRSDLDLILLTLGTQTSTQTLESIDAAQCLHIKCYQQNLVQRLSSSCIHPITKHLWHLVPSLHGKQMGNSGNTVRLYFFGLQNRC